jgi:uncharacterized membrane protein YjgN (DUF898 family)
MSAPPLFAPTRPFVFTATGTAYFRIWIVNLLLTIVTVGFYSPWAKVRRLRYFYGNTTFDGSPFEFHGRPIALLKGRLVGLVLLIAYSQTARFSLMLWLCIVAALFAAMPWLLWKSLRFRMANASYRGIRFAFDGTIGQAYLTFIPLMLAALGPSMITVLAQPQATSSQAVMLHFLGRLYLGLGIALLLAPWFYFRLKVYQHRHARLGTTPFGFDGKVAGAYMIFVKAILIVVLFIVVGVVAGVVVGAPVWFVANLAGFNATPAGLFAGVATGYLVLITSMVTVRAMVQNFVWNHSLLGGHRFMSLVGRTRSFRIEIVNVVLTVVTLGLFWPFAVVRSLRYRIESVEWSGDSATLERAPGDARIGATGEETAELFGLDIAL